MTGWVLGIVGGSGLYQLAGLEDVRHQTVETPWGSPSGQLVRGRLNGIDLVFLARHGKGHSLSPTAINYRANIHALKRAGVTDILSLSACGSMREELTPGSFVVVDQYVDRTFAREKSFFRPWLCGACPDGRSGLQAPVGHGCERGARGRGSIMSSRAAPIWRWKARNFPPARKAASTAPGAWM